MGTIDGWSGSRVLKLVVGITFREGVMILMFGVPYPNLDALGEGLESNI